MELNAISRQFELLGERIVNFRRTLHRMAELSFEEYRTAEFIKSELEKEGIECKSIVKTGVLAVVNGKNPDPQHPVILRADIDALPIQESTGLEFAADTDGVMHACGHDLHTAALMGALIGLKSLSEEFDGTVWGIFQPGEEVAPGGASEIIASGLFDGIKPRAVIGQHIEAGMANNLFGFRSGQCMASADEIHIKVSGSGGHAAMQHKYSDTVLTSAQLIVALQQIAARNCNPMTPTIISIGRVEALGATNVIPSEVTMCGTMRTIDEVWRVEIKNRIREIASGLAVSSRTNIDVQFSPGYPSVINDSQLTAASVLVAQKVVGRENVIEQPIKMTAEDFGFYGSVAPSMFYRFGAGVGSNDAHCANFNPDDSNLPTVAKLLCCLAINVICDDFR